MAHFLTSMICINLTFSVALSFFARPVQFDFDDGKTSNDVMPLLDNSSVNNSTEDYGNINCGSIEEIIPHCKSNMISCRGKCGYKFYPFEVYILNETPENPVCSCDRSCLNFGDCCWDFDDECANQTQMSIYQIHCVYGGYGVVASCPESWKGFPDTPNSSNRSHHKLVEDNPVKDKYTGIHYRNISYLVCNGIDVDNAEHWVTRMKTSGTHYNISELKAIFTGETKINKAGVKVQPRDTTTIRFCKKFKESSMLVSTCKSCKTTRTFDISYISISHVCQTYSSTMDSDSHAGQRCKLAPRPRKRKNVIEKHFLVFIYNTVDKAQRVIISQDFQQSTRWGMIDCDLKNDFKCNAIETCPKEFVVKVNKCYRVSRFVLHISLNSNDLSLMNGTRLADQISEPAPMTVVLEPGTIITASGGLAKITFSFNVIYNDSLGTSYNSSFTEYIYDGVKSILNGKNTDELDLSIRGILEESSKILPGYALYTVIRNKLDNSWRLQLIEGISISTKKSLAERSGLYTDYDAQYINRLMITIYVIVSTCNYY